MNRQLLISAAIAAATIVVCSVLWAKADMDAQAWTEFKAMHHCVLRPAELGDMPGELWDCDDGAHPHHP